MKRIENLKVKKNLKKTQQQRQRQPNLNVKCMNVCRDCEKLPISLSVSLYDFYTQDQHRQSDKHLNEREKNNNKCSRAN